jgi:hypothetical protein
MVSQLNFTLIENTIDFVILELRKFFGVLPPYDGLMPLGLIPPDLIYQATAEFQPIPGQLFISDEEPMEDRNIPSIVVTGYSATPKPLGFGQRGLSPRQTRETNPLVSTAVRCATTQAQVLGSDFVPGKVIDTITLALNDRVLIKNQAIGGENGVYVVHATGAPLRSADFSTSTQFVEGMAIPVLVGHANGGKYFSQLTPNIPSAPIVVGSTPLTYENISGNVLEWDEFVEAADIPINIGIRCGSTSQRARLADLLFTALNNLRYVRGELQKKQVIIQPPGLRMNPPSEEPVMGGAAYQLIYKCDFSMTLFQQWNNRVLRMTRNATQIIPEGTKVLL